MSISTLFQEDLRVVNVGSPSFNPDYDRQHVSYIHLDWRPVAGGKSNLIQALERLQPYRDRIAAANQEALHRVLESEAKLIDVATARDVIPGMSPRQMLHAGPPVDFSDMAGPMQGAIVGAILYEGWADTQETAYALAASGEITFDAAHHHQAVGPMSGVISPSMPVHVLYDPIHNRHAYCTINEGLGKVLRYGANSDEVIGRLKWIEAIFADVLGQAVRISGGIDIKNLLAQALHMGDEGHNRNKAASSLFLREIAPYILDTDTSLEHKKAALEFIKNNEHYFLNLSMPYAKLALDSARGIPFSSMVTVMSRNGVDFGIQLASGDRWYVDTANYVRGLLFPGFEESDSARDIGDSAITETCGIGGFAMGGAPAIVQFVGGAVEQAFQYSRQMLDITIGTHRVFTLPTLDFQPTALGIDIIEVVRKQILPIINTGIAHKDAGVGQIGAGLVHPPMSCFEQALLDFADICEQGGLQ